VIKYFTEICRLSNTRLFTKIEFGDDNTPEYAANYFTEKMSEEERIIQIKEFKDLFEEAMINMGPDKQLNNYLNWNLFKI
jgi:hypothetical protein